MLQIGCGPLQDSTDTKALKVSLVHSSYGSIIRVTPGSTPQHRRDPETWKSNYPFWSGYSLLLIRAGHGSPGQTDSRRRPQGDRVVANKYSMAVPKMVAEQLVGPRLSLLFPQMPLLVSSNNPARQLTR